MVRVWLGVRVRVRVGVRVWLGVRGYEIRGIEFHSVIRPVDNESGSLSLLLPLSLSSIPLYPDPSLCYLVIHMFYILLHETLTSV